MGAAGIPSISQGVGRVVARFGWCGDGRGVAETLERQEEVWEIVAGRHGQIKARLIRTERRPRCTQRSSSIQHGQTPDNSLVAKP
jgi:hypothetical protein